VFSNLNDLMLKPRLLLLAGLFLAALISVAQVKLDQPSTETNHAPTLPAGKETTAAVSEPSAKELSQRYEKVRAACIQGRRRICGRVVEISTNGLVIDSGFTSLLRPELTRSWVAPASVLAERPPNLIEESTAGAPAAGLVLLTNTPRRPTPKLYDYIIIEAYPAGQYHYKPVPNVDKVIRRFSARIEAAIRQNMAE
jgi:hypothetical protein